MSRLRKSSDIFLGVIGCYGWWSVKLNPISMITITMSIGFSVEFTAHIIYGFVSNKGGLTPNERTAQTLERHAIPIIQASSNLLFIRLSLDMDLYRDISFDR